MKIEQILEEITKICRQHGYNSINDAYDQLCKKEGSEAK